MKYNIKLGSKIKKTLIKIGAMVLIIFTLGNTIVAYSFENENNITTIEEMGEEMAVNKPKTIKVDTPLSKYVTSGKRSRTTKIAWHYTGAHDVSGKSTCYNWFLPIAKGKHPGTYASAHFVMDLNGDIYEMIPLNYVAYTTNSANAYAIGIECATTGTNDHYSDKEYVSMVKLGAWLAQYYGLDPRTDFIRHYDVTQKICPRYFVNNTAKWTQFKLDCYNYMKGKLTEANIRNCTNGKGNSILSATEVNESKVNQTGTVECSEALNVRKEPNASATKLGSLKDGTKVTIVAKCSNGWLKIKFEDGYGYVNGKYITNIKDVVVFKQYIARCTVDVLNCREQPTTDSKVVDTIEDGTAITIIAEKTVNGKKWLQAKLGYWVFADYMEFVRYI